MESLLSQCLDSILQTPSLAAVEAVVVNDGSRDASLRIARRLREPLSRYDSGYRQAQRQLRLYNQRRSARSAGRVRADSRCRRLLRRRTARRLYRVSAPECRYGHDSVAVHRGAAAVGAQGGVRQLFAAALRLRPPLRHGASIRRRGDTVLHDALRELPHRVAARDELPPERGNILYRPGVGVLSLVQGRHGRFRRYSALPLQPRPRGADDGCRRANCAASRNSCRLRRTWQLISRRRTSRVCRRYVRLSCARQSGTECVWCCANICSTCPTRLLPMRVSARYIRACGALPTIAA